MLRGQDVLVLLKLSNVAEGWTVRSLAADLDLDTATVHRALQRLADARLLDLPRRKVNRSNAEEFLLHGLKYAFPARQAGASRGVPTAWAAPPLVDLLAPSDDPPPVWPYARGRARGVALQPLHANASVLAGRDPQLGEQLALLDAIRLGDARVRKLAAERLKQSLRAPMGS